jgi:hypothetical protein
MKTHNQYSLPGLLTILFFNQGKPTHRPLGSPFGSIQFLNLIFSQYEIITKIIPWISFMPAFGMFKP